jgi:DUF1365 family protein
MESALYCGLVRHRRFAPRRHRFAYPLFMLYLDLDELAEVGAVSRLLSVRRPAVAWIRRADYFGDPGLPWAEAVRRLVAERTGRYPAGPVRLLTHPRTLGVRMNPVSLYYCHDGGGRLAAVVAEVTNTPWGERHLYVVEPDAARAAGGAWEASFPKELHVSPFFPMDLDYRWRLLPPGPRLVVHMENLRAGVKVFDATLRLERRPFTHPFLRRALLRHPAMTMRIFLWIYLHAVLLKLAGVPFHPHPSPSGPSRPSGPGESSGPSAASRSSRPSEASRSSGPSEASRPSARPAP